MSAVSVIGLGLMGSAIARTLIANSYRVTVWNRSPEKATPLVEAGAVLAAEAAQAIAASPVTIVCIKSQRETLALLQPLSDRLEGKTIIDVSTGDAAASEELFAFLQDASADALVAAINAHPSGIGKDETTLMVVGPPATWERCSKLIKVLGGSSAYLGREPNSLVAIFSALFTARQGFLFGLFYGAQLCRKAGIPVQTFVEQMPISFQLMETYYSLFAETVPERLYDDPPATLATYADVYDDVLATFEAFGTQADLPRLMSDLAHKGMTAGHADKQVTAIVEVLDRN